jgi:protein O-mannosyl-transferase
LLSGKRTFEPNSTRVKTLVEVTQPIAAPEPAKSLLKRLTKLLAQTWVRCLTLAFVGIVPHLPALQGQLIWDDGYLAGGNPFMKSPLLVLEAFRHHLFLDSYSPHYRPVQNISYIADYFFWNTDPTGFHLSNILWHVGSGILLYLLLNKVLTRLGQSRTSPGNGLLSVAAFLIALFWVVHPVHSAAVDYISGRADSLAFFFSCGAWLLYLRGRDNLRPARRSLCFILAGLSLLMGLCSRESACLWVAIFLVHLFFCEKGLAMSAKCLVLVACLVVVGAYAGLRQLPGQRAATPAASGWVPSMRAVLMLRALGDYGRLMVWPANLHMERTVFNPDTLQNSESWRKNVGVEYLSIAGLGVAAVLAFGACRKGRARPIRAFGAFWFIFAYLPISNLLELNATVAEHWLYLPSVGFLIFVVGCCLELPRQSVRFAPALALVAILALAARTFVRSTDWADSETFYRRTLAAGGMSVRVALNLGQVYSSRGEHAKAEVLFRRILKISPDYPVARTNLGDALFRQGKTEEANAIFAAANKAAEESRKEHPRTWIAALSLAHMHYKEDKSDAALAVLEKARKDYPGTWDLISLEAEILRRTRGAEAALPLVREFTDAHWWHNGSYLALGRLEAEAGKGVEAEAALRHASRLDVHDAESLNLIARMNMWQNRLQDAYEAQRRAVSRQPDQPRQYILLSDILEKMGRNEEARAALAQVSQLNAVAHSQRGVN